MITNPNFKIDVSVTEKCYKSKPTPTDYRQMRWNKTKMSLSSFISMVRMGYSYCHIYYRNLRRKNKFLYTQTISIDVDDTDTDLETFYRQCQLKPTFAYETFSNGTGGNYSYRLVYVFKERINIRAFGELYEKICRMTNLDKTKDHCGKVITQLMNGTTYEAKVFRSNRIYSSITDLPVDATEQEQIVTYQHSLLPVVPNVYKPRYSSAIYQPNNINSSKSNQKQYKSNDPDWKKQLESISVPLKVLAESRQEFL